MNERKRQSINALAGAIAEAESKLYNEDSTDLNGLRALLNGFLYFEKRKGKRLKETEGEQWRSFHRAKGVN